jgi:hypothetical protein
MSYNQSSPYFTTQIFGGKYLDLLDFRPIPAQPDDIFTQISPAHEHRPDKLAGDLYGDDGLWWVFIVRNMNILQDPIWDFTTDKYIYIPKLTTLQQYL